MSGILINGIVSQRDRQPFVHIDVDGKLVQLTVSQARSVARQLELAASRAEADAMIHKFFSSQEFPEGANAAIMIQFRDFRQKLDMDKAVTDETEWPHPENGSCVFCVKPAVPGTDVCEEHKRLGSDRYGTQR